MSGYPANWHVYVNGDPVLKPRRRRVFHKGRRHDRRLAGFLVMLALLLAAAAVMWTGH